MAHSAFYNSYCGHLIAIVTEVVPKLLNSAVAVSSLNGLVVISKENTLSSLDNTEAVSRGFGIDGPVVGSNNQEFHPFASWGLGSQTRRIFKTLDPNSRFLVGNLEVRGARPLSSLGAEDGSFQHFLSSNKVLINVCLPAHLFIVDFGEFKGLKMQRTTILETRKIPSRQKKNKRIPPTSTRKG